MCGLRTADSSARLHVSACLPAASRCAADESPAQVERVDRGVVACGAVEHDAVELEDGERSADELVHAGKHDVERCRRA